MRRSVSSFFASSSNSSNSASSRSSRRSSKLGDGGGDGEGGVLGRGGRIPCFLKASLLRTTQPTNVRR